MRLIDADALIEKMRRRKESGEYHGLPLNIIEWLIAIIHKEPAVEKCADCTRREFYQKGYQVGYNEAHEEFQKHLCQIESSIRKEIAEKLNELPTKTTSKMVESKEVPEWFYEVITGFYINKESALAIIKAGEKGEHHETD